MTTERIDQSATPEIQQNQPGVALAAQRQALGWSVEQAAEQLKLAVRQVVALESGDYAALPSPAVARGFVRAYAKILRLDPTPLVALVPMNNPAPADSAGTLRRDRPTSFSHTRYPTHGKRSGLPLAWIAGVVVVVAAVGAAWNFGLLSMPASDGPAAAETSLTTVAADKGASEAGPTDIEHNPSVPLISVPTPTSEHPAPAPTVAGPAPAAAVTSLASPLVSAAAPPANVDPVAPVAAAPVAAAPAAAAHNTLVLAVRADSWIEVRPRGGKALIARLVRAGNTETFEIPGDTTLVVGNPAAVTATLGGAEVALPLVPGKTISRVSLK